MKKIGIIVLSFMCFMFSGCGEKVSLDMEKINKEIPNLTTDKFSFLDVTREVENPDKKVIYENLVDKFDNDMKDLGISSENIESMIFRVQADGTPAYILIQPKKDKKDAVKSELKTYINKNKKDNQVLESEYEGYLIYILGTDANNAEVLKRIKNTKEPVFGMITAITDDALETVTGLKKDQVEEYAIGVPTMIVQSNSYLVVKPAKGKKDDVKKALDAYMTKLEEQWKTYLPDQYELVKDRKVEEHGDYLIYIISNQNDLVFNKIKDLTK